jgi:DNA repair protein RadC
MEKIIEIQTIKQVKKPLAKKYQKLLGEQLPKVTSPLAIVPMLQKLIGDEDRENFLVVGLNTKNEVVCVHKAHTGSINATIVSPREIFKALILNNCNSVILSHNHPSGDCRASEEDRDVTLRLQECGEFLGIEILDHIIVSEKSYSSFKMLGYM